MRDRYGLAGKVVLITGAGGGLGSCLAQVLAARGARLALVDIDGGAAQRVAAPLGEGTALALHGDVTDLASMQAAVREAIATFGQMDVAIANAGILGRGATFRNLTTTEVEGVMAVNVGGVVNTASAAFESIIERKGQFVAISSVYAFVNGAGAIPYSMSKAAVAQLGRGLSSELAPHGASAMTAYFALLETEMIGNGVDAHPEVAELLAITPKFLLRRLAPAVAANAIADGIEARKSRVVMPGRWRPLFSLQGVAGPAIDKRNARMPAMSSALNKLDARDRQPATSASAPTNT